MSRQLNSSWLSACKEGAITLPRRTVSIAAISGHLTGLVYLSSRW